MELGKMNNYKHSNGIDNCILSFNKKSNAYVSISPMKINISKWPKDIWISVMPIYLDHNI